MAGCALRLIASASSRLRGSSRSIGFGRRQLARRRADHLRIDRLADGEVDLGGIEVGAPAAEPRLRLRHVGRRDVAGVEPLLGGGERLAQERHIDALRLDQGLVGEHVHIGGDRVEQHALPDIAQRLAPGLHLRLRLAHRVGGLEAVEQGLVDGEADRPGAQRGGLEGVVGQEHAHRLQAGGEAGHDLRPVAGERLRHVLVGAALARALGVERGLS